MLSKADERRAKAFQCLERAGRTRDAEAQLILLHAFARQWWRLAELKRISDRQEQRDGKAALAVSAKGAEIEVLLPP
jgi:hypothetical protein